MCQREHSWLSELSIQMIIQKRITYILKKGKLFGNVTKIKPFVKQLVLKFYTNMSKDIYDRGSLNFDMMEMKGR